MKILTKIIELNELKEAAQRRFGDFVKAVVDIDRDLIAIEAELHSDLEALLLRDGSKQQHLWGINLYPEASLDEFVEFDSMINIRASQGNRSRGVENPAVQKRIVEVVSKWTKK